MGYTSRSKAIKALKSKYGKAVFTSFGNYTKLAKEFEDAYLVIMLSSQLLYTVVKNLLTLRKFLENCIFVTILPFISYQKVEKSLHGRTHLIFETNFFQGVMVQ